jgi:formylglycine-generating enzyme required for sulfatase activity
MKMQLHFSIMSLTLIGFGFLNATWIIDVKHDFIKIDNNLFTSRHEVTNAEYNEFLKSLLNEQQWDEHALCIYDSTQWLKKLSNAETKPLALSYHSNKRYDNYPIVNITADGAYGYCRWLTEKYNNNPKRKYKKVIFRLPSEQEWMKMIANDTKNSTHNNYNIKTKNQSNGIYDHVSDGGLFTTASSQYKPNNKGVFDVIGNVAEITAEGYLKGGSWDNELAECSSEKRQNYNLPDPRVGFRIFMEIIEK